MESGKPRADNESSKKAPLKTARGLLKRPSKFSKKNLIIFALCFALVGGYIIFRTFAATVIPDPTHLIDAYWTFPGKGYTVTSTSTEMSPKVDPSPDGYYYASTFWFKSKNNDYGKLGNFHNLGYMGLQTEDAFHVLPATSLQSKTASITIYGAISSKAASSNIFARCGDPTNEGQQCQLVDPYTWVPGHTYRFNVSLQTANNKKGSEIWTASFTDLADNTTIQLGTINVPTSWQDIDHTIATFHERFDGQTSDCSAVKPSYVVFSNVRENNLLTGVNNIPSFVTGSTLCPGYISNSVSTHLAYSYIGSSIYSAQNSAPTPFAPRKAVMSVPNSCLEYGGEVLLGPIDPAACQADGSKSNAYFSGTACIWSAAPSPTWGACPADESSTGAGSYMSVPNSPDFDYGPNFSFEIWVNPGTNQLKSYQPIACNAVFPSAGWLLSTDVNGGLIFQAGNGTNLGWAKTDSVSLNPNAWNQVVAVVSNGTKLLYLNGNLVATGTGGSGGNPTTRALDIGGDCNGTNSFSGFSFDQAAIYRRALTPTEITANFASPASSPSPGPLSSWNFEEALTSQPAADAEGLHPGTYVGNPTLGLPGIVGTGMLVPAATLSTVSVGPVTATVYANPSNMGSVDFTQVGHALFTQQLHQININPSTAFQALYCSNVTGVTPYTQPAAEVYQNADGTCSSQDIQGNGYQAGAGSLANFDMTLTTNMTVPVAGNVSFYWDVDDAWLLGAGPRIGGTEQPGYVSGSYVNAPSRTLELEYSIIGAGNTSLAGGPLTINFPAAGVYPIEVDYVNCCSGGAGSGLELQMELGPTESGIPVPQTP